MNLPVRLRINGAVFDVSLEARRTLADAIRKDCGLTGTHVGCEHGVCGSCTVIVDGDPVRSCLMFAVQAEGSEIVTVEGMAKLATHYPVSTSGGADEQAAAPSTSTSALSSWLGLSRPSAPNRSGWVEAAHALTGVDGRDESGHDGGNAYGDAPPHPLQQAFIEHHGLQCGFCTPGFLMLAAAVLQRDPHIADVDLIDALSSNLCRCTGYHGIIDAVLAAARAMRASNSER